MTDNTIASVPTLSLRAGSAAVQIPQLGFGVWQVPDDEVGPAVEKALEVGYRHIDTAKAYENESGVGRVLSATSVPRSQIFLTTKLWNSDQGYQQTLDAFEASHQRLGADAPVDLYLIHWPTPQHDRYVDTYRALIELREAGKIRAAGVCNFEIEHLERVNAELGEYPSINQIELHPFLQQNQLREFHQAHDIVTEAWSPLASGGEVLQNPDIAAIADKYGKSAAQVILRWHLQVGNVVIPKSVTPARIEENFDIFGFELDGDDLSTIAGLDKGERTGPDPMEFNQA